MRTRDVIITFGTIGLISFIFFIILFFFAATFYLKDPVNKDLSDFVVKDTIGNVIILGAGVLSIICAIILVIAWNRLQKWKDLRYKMAFYLYHSNVKRGQKIPLDYLAKVAICTFDEISTTLEMMIGRNELKGMVDRDRRLYIHLGLTRKGLVFLQALPPAKLDQLEGVRRWALKAAELDYQEVQSGSISREEDLEELVPIEEADTQPGPQESRLCFQCGKLTPSNTHFCTYCGEEL